MARLIEFELPDGATLIAEVDEVERLGPKPAGAGDGVIQRATVGLEQAIAKVRPFAELLLAQLRGLSSTPSEVTVEFGIKLDVEAGALIAKTGAEGNCKVTLSWKKAGEIKS
jgi:hypothetical protein